MKIIETQSAVLTNFEVYDHIKNRPLGSGRDGKKGPASWETLKKEILQYLTTLPNPLAQQPISYTRECIGQLVQKLRPYDLTKGEMIMVFNLRPASIAALNTIIEDMEDRFDEDKQNEIATIVAEVLGRFPADPLAEEPNGHAE